MRARVRSWRGWKQMTEQRPRVGSEEKRESIDAVAAEVAGAGPSLTGSASGRRAGKSLAKTCRQLDPVEAAERDTHVGVLVPGVDVAAHARVAGAEVAALLVRGELLLVGRLHLALGVSV
jgi:hypothetical protein